MIGPNTEGLITASLARRPHPEQGCPVKTATCLLSALTRIDSHEGRRRAQPE